MSEFLTTSGLSYAIEKIISTANSRIVIVSPYIQISRNYRERLIEAQKRNVSITIVFGKDDLQKKQNDILAEFKNLELYFCDNLHAKCYMNEGISVIGSMNLYEFSQTKNREMGILIDRKKEEDIYRDIEREIYSIIQISKKEFHGGREKLTMAELPQEHMGYCIKCGKAINHDKNKPMCDSCFELWFGSGNQKSNEKYCHICGKPNKTSIDRPLCYICYKKYYNVMT
ncbi:MAG: phospholipase D family protein [Treponema sp.]|nr:phospholipase D family protein [Treponema sp.]